MSSTYYVLCLSHDPASIVNDPGCNRAEEAEAIVRERMAGHEHCDLMIGRYSYPLVELGCPSTLGRRTSPRPNGITCCHGSTIWVDRDWLWLLAAAHQSPDPDMMAAIERGHSRQCLPWERLRRLRAELGFELKPTESARVQREIDGKLIILDAMGGEPT